jgi:hypothetical protein
MTCVRISHYVECGATSGESDWYFCDATSQFVRIERTSVEQSPGLEPDARALVSWIGCHTRAFGRRQEGTITYVLTYPVPLDYFNEFDAWFSYEHMPLLLEEPTWYGCDFFRALAPSTHTFAAIHYLEPGALTSKARDRSIATPWWNRLKQCPWFDKGFDRAILRRI